jgi:hypothetical protein
MSNIVHPGGQLAEVTAAHDATQSHREAAPRYQENITCIIRILSPLIVELGALPRLASENRPEWDELYNRLAKLTNISMATIESHSDPYAALKQIADRLGNFLISGEGSAFR